MLRMFCYNRISKFLSVRFDDYIVEYYLNEE